MPKYIVFDVETPNRYNNRMSAIGISIVENGKIVKSFFSYVDPEQSFDWFNTKLTGIDARTVAGAPTFPELWKKIEPILSSGSSNFTHTQTIEKEVREASSHYPMIMHS